MNHTAQHSPAWITFTYVSFAASAFMVAIGIWLLPLDLSLKGYLSMGFLMTVQSCITMTKTMRDMHESDKLVNRIEDAKAERLLMEVERGAGLRDKSTDRRRASDRPPLSVGDSRQSDRIAEDDFDERAVVFPVAWPACGRLHNMADCDDLGRLDVSVRSVISRPFSVHLHTDRVRRRRAFRWIP